MAGFDPPTEAEEGLSQGRARGGAERTYARQASALGRELGGQHLRCSKKTPHGSVAGMVETLTAVAAVVGAVSGVIAAVGVLIVNGKLDRLTGRVDANTAAITAHTNAPGLHR